MNRLRNRLILIFLAATLAPLAGTVWITTSLLEHSLDYSSTGELDTIAKSLQRTAVELYRYVRDDLKRQAQSGALKPHKYLPADRAQWPAAIKAFAESEEGEGVKGPSPAMPVAGTFGRGRFRRSRTQVGTP